MATRRPGTVASVNRQIDALLKAGRNPARKAPANRAATRVTLLAANPGVKSFRKTDKRLRANRPEAKQWLLFAVQEKRTESGEWKYTAGFHKQLDAENYARHLHSIRPDMFFRVVDKK